MICADKGEMEIEERWRSRSDGDRGEREIEDKQQCHNEVSEIFGSRRDNIEERQHEVSEIFGSRRDNMKCPRFSDNVAIETFGSHEAMIQSWIRRTTQT